MVAKFFLTALLSAVLNFAFAHKLQGFEQVLTPQENDMLLIEATMKNSVKRLYGNRVELISMVDERVLFQGVLDENKPLIVPIPKESYWVYIYIQDKDIVEEGPAPKGGFDIIVESKKDKAFLYTLGISLALLLVAAFLSFRRYLNYKKSIAKHN